MRDYYELKRWGYPNSYPPTTKKCKESKPIKPFECVIASTVGSAVLLAFIWYMTTLSW